MKKLFVVSDIHGHYTELKAALDRAGFDRNDPAHLLICCGDYFDRGSENAQVLWFAWRIPGTGEPGGLPSMGSHRVGHD